MTAVIHGNHLSFSYDEEHEIIKDSSFEIYKNEFIGVIGPNGGGKTTLLKMILGFLKPDAGTLTVLNISPKEAEKKMAYVPQSLRYDRHFPISTLELVLLGRLSNLPWYGIFSKDDKEKALDALHQMGIAHLAKRPFGELSGGQQQRALIARSIAGEPEILLLDEPTASVDREAEKSILDLLKTLQEKMTILMVTHDLQTAIDRVDRILCVQQTVVSYSPKEVCEHYAMGLYHPPLLNIKSSLS